MGTREQVLGAWANAARAAQERREVFAELGLERSVLAAACSDPSQWPGFGSAELAGLLLRVCRAPVPFAHIITALRIERVESALALLERVANVHGDYQRLAEGPSGARALLKQVVAEEQAEIARVQRELERDLEAQAAEDRRRAELEHAVVVLETERKELEARLEALERTAEVEPEEAATELELEQTVAELDARRAELEPRASTTAADAVRDFVHGG